VGYTYPYTERADLDDSFIPVKVIPDYLTSSEQMTVGGYGRIILPHL
jgi:hypothetical protein